MNVKPIKPESAELNLVATLQRTEATFQAVRRARFALQTVVEAKAHAATLIELALDQLEDLRELPPILNADAQEQIHKTVGELSGKLNRLKAEQ